MMRLTVYLNQNQSKMRQLLFFVGLIPLASFAQQNYNPFVAIGKKVTVVTLSNGRYKETYGGDTVKRIGNVMFDIRTNKIVKFLEENDTTTYEFRKGGDLSTRWLSIDPLSTKFPYMSPYVFVENNPIILIDKDGREPIRGSAGTIQQAVAYLKSVNAKTIADIDKIYGSTKYDGSVQGFVRYVYTENNGWIDLKHYFGTIVRSEIAMDALENTQCADGMASCYSYEDLPSNDFGGNAPVFDYKSAGVSPTTGTPIIMKTQKQGEELFSTVEKQFNDANATTPESAPNWKQIPASSDRAKLPYFKDEFPYVHSEGERAKMLKTGNYVPQNHSEQAYNLKDFPAAPDSIEKTEQK